MAPHFVRYIGGSAVAFYQNDGMRSGFLYPADCAMSYRVVWYSLNPYGLATKVITQYELEVN